MFNVVGHDGPMLPQQADNCSRFDGAEALRWVEELKGALQDGRWASTEYFTFKICSWGSPRLGTLFLRHLSIVHVGGLQTERSAIDTQV